MSVYSVLFSVAELGPVANVIRKIYFSFSKEIPLNNKSSLYHTVKQLAQVLSFLPLGRCIIRSWQLPVKDVVKDSCIKT